MRKLEQRDENSKRISDIWCDFIASCKCCYVLDVVFTETIRRSHARVCNYRRRETGLTPVLRGLVFIVAGAILVVYRTHFRPVAADTAAMQKFETETGYYNNGGEGCWFTGTGSPLVSPC